MEGLLSGTFSAPVTSDHDGNIIVYLAGYLGNKAARKYKVEASLLFATAVPADPWYNFLRDKQYSDLTLGENCLKVPRCDIPVCPPTPFFTFTFSFGFSPPPTLSISFST